MPNLRNKVKDDLGAAMKARDTKKVSALRMLVNAVRNKEISLRQGEDVVLSDEQAIEVIASEIKKRRESIEAYEQGNRPELAQAEKDEIEILSVYMPAQLSNEELEAIIKDVASEVGSGANMGAVMGKVLPRVKGRADGGRVSAIVKKILG